MRTISLLFALLCSTLLTHAQPAAQMKLWDAHERTPLIWEVEFDGSDSLLATYDAIYGHGAMIENETYALRLYAQPWPRIDLYGKARPEPELHVTNFYTTPEQLAEGYGIDALLVGETIGVGSLLGWDSEKMTALSPVERRGQRVRYSQRDSSSVEAWVKGWEYDNKKIDLTQRLTMHRGERNTRVDVWVEGASDSTLFVTGVQRLKTDLGHATHATKGRAETWGTNVPQPGDPIGVRLGIRVPRQYIYKVKEEAGSTLFVVHPIGGHISYEVWAETSVSPSFKMPKTTSRP